MESTPTTHSRRILRWAAVATMSVALPLGLAATPAVATAAPDRTIETVWQDCDCDPSDPCLWEQNPGQLNLGDCDRDDEDRERQRRHEHEQGQLHSDSDMSLRVPRFDTF